jgi:hypothetical protein
MESVDIDGIAAELNGGNVMTEAMHDKLRKL